MKRVQVRRTSSLPYFVLGIIVTFVLAPFVWPFAASLDGQATLYPRWPWPPTFRNFVRAFQEYDAIVLVANSVLLAASTASLVVITCALAGYSLSRLRCWWKQHLLYGILLTRIVPPIAIVVPLYSLFIPLGLVDTPWGVILVLTALNTPLGLWILKTFFDTIPIELEEAAWLDGASRFQSLFRIVFPLAGPGVGTAALFSFIEAWGNFLVPLILVSSPNQRPLSIGLFQAFVSYTKVDYGFLAAASLLYMAPPVLLFIFTRRRLIRALGGGGLRE
ncbi:MAG: carbohydrate ABC transporter permease [Armatimonadota bacterium]|nr:carbohydrate ABC transporter permease [Armatimonadota bacterium]MDR7500395.1 carbohydrate ABC transporter permease [Armatimonadota bacterium]MDR7548041.1 carbohydrate ABC transporter permease [Armatimonadota bacterium]